MAKTDHVEMERWAESKEVHQQRGYLVAGRVEGDQAAWTMCCMLNFHLLMIQ